jgi:two-component system cell cycle response regulator DivK
MPKKILIVDDDPDVILFLSTLLEDHGYQTITASNGRDGLRRTRSDCPDLILLDLMMPQKSGISLLSDLKRAAWNPFFRKTDRAMIVPGPKAL